MSDAASSFLFVDDPHAFRDAAALIVRVPAKARGKEKVLNVLSRGLRFPKYFGGNWDALDECLNDLSWLEGVTSVVLVHEGLPFLRGGEQLSTYLALVRDVVVARKAAEKQPSLAVVFPTAVRDVVEGVDAA